MRQAQGERGVWSRRAWLALRARLELASARLKNAKKKKITPVLCRLGFNTVCRVIMAISTCFYPGDFDEKFEKSRYCLNYWNIVLSFGDITEISYETPCLPKSHEFTSEQLCDRSSCDWHVLSSNFTSRFSCGCPREQPAILKLKVKYHAILLSFQNPKLFVCQQKQRNNCQGCYKLSPQCNRTVDFCLWPET